MPHTLEELQTQARSWSPEERAKIADFCRIRSVTRR